MRVTGIEHCCFVTDQFVHRHSAWAVVDHVVTTCLWLQSWSSKEGCLTKMVLNDRTWHGTWWAKTCKCHWGRRFLKIWAERPGCSRS